MLALKTKTSNNFDFEPAAKSVLILHRARLMPWTRVDTLWMPHLDLQLSFLAVRCQCVCCRPWTKITNKRLKENWELRSVQQRMKRVTRMDFSRRYHEPFFQLSRSNFARC